jgi:hypothetical protein
MLLTLVIITSLLVVLLTLSLIYDWEGATVTAVILLVLVGILGWLFAGATVAVKEKYKIIPKNNFEILIGKDKVILTDIYTDYTQTFKDAKSYNIINDKIDNYYIEDKSYNMYNFKIDKTIIITDTITDQDILEQVKIYDKNK